jgi:hypothetical protein
VESLLRARVWAIGLQERGAPIFDQLKTLAISNPDAQVRADAGFALGYAEGPVVRDALALTLDPALEVRSAVRIIFELMDNPRTRDAAWQWLGGHEDAALGRVPAMFQSFYASVGDNFCSDPERESFNQVLGVRLRALNGGELGVDRALESIDSCIALRASLGDSLTVALKEVLH